MTNCQFKALPYLTTALCLENKPTPGPPKPRDASYAPVRDISKTKLDG